MRPCGCVCAYAVRVRLRRCDRVAEWEGEGEEEESGESGFSVYILGLLVNGPCLVGFSGPETSNRRGELKPVPLSPCFGSRNP